MARMRASLSSLPLPADCLSWLWPSAPPAPPSPTIEVAPARRKGASRSAAEAKAWQIIVSKIGVDQERAKRPAKLSDLGADTLDLAELALALEEAFDITISGEESAEWRTVSDVLDLVVGKLGE